MKVRQGFVSNSSSSSFVCMVSGDVEGGWDMSLGEAGMCECVNGHVFCERFRLDFPAPVDSDNDEDEDYDEDPNYDVPAEQCPICTLKHITDTDLLAYAIKKNNWDRKKIEESLRSEFATYSDFKKDV